MKIAKITPVGKKPVYDISVGDAEHYVLENGVVTHNTGIYLSSDNIWIIGRSQEKEGTEITGYKFTINIEKSRHVREKSKIPITITHSGGINKWSGLFELAQEAGFIIKPKVGWYQTVDPETGEISEKSYRARDLEENADYYEKLLASQKFKDYVKSRYTVAGGRKDVSTEGEIGYSDEEDDE